jgi:hypothetical protein
MTELEEIYHFCKASHVTDHIPEMEISLETANAYSVRVGMMLNEATEDFEKSHDAEISRLMEREDYTETTRKAHLLAMMSPKKKLVSDLKVLSRSLRTIQMTLMQAIKTRRDER